MSGYVKRRVGETSGWPLGFKYSHSSEDTQIHDHLRLADPFAELMLEFKSHGYFQPACPRDWV